MPRRVDPRKQKRDWRWYASFGLNAIVALSMVLGTVFIFTGAPAPRSAIPTIEVPTAAPTPVNSAPTPVPPTPTPKASLDHQFAVPGIPETATLFMPGF